MIINVFTCGVFDLLHWGHVDFLQRAKALGDRLIVGVNDDDYVRRRKQREPLYPLRERLIMLRALECVDDVQPFSEDDPCALLRSLTQRRKYFGAGDDGQRWIVAKGSEYSPANAPEAALIESLGGQFVALESLPIHTADILQRLSA